MEETNPWNDESSVIPYSTQSIGIRWDVRATGSKVSNQLNHAESNWIEYSAMMGGRVAERRNVALPNWDGRSVSAWGEIEFPISQTCAIKFRLTFDKFENIVISFENMRNCLSALFYLAHSHLTKSIVPSSIHLVSIFIDCGFSYARAHINCMFVHMLIVITARVIIINQSHGFDSRARRTRSVPAFV